jgi:hypothetical protein
MSLAAPILTRDARLLTALGLHFLACLFFAETGLPGRFVPAQALAGLVIAFLVMTTLCWQWKLFGDPRRPLDFAGHLAIFGSVFFLIGRLYVKNPARDTLLDKISGLAKWGAGMLGGIPGQVFDVLSSPGVALLFLAVCLALSLPRGAGLGALITVSFLTLALCATGPAFTQSGTLLLGALTFGLALWLQHDDPAEREYWTGVLRQWEHDRAVRGDLELKVRLLRRIREESRPLTEGECLGTVARALGCEPDDAPARAALARVAGQLVREDSLATLYSSPEGKTLAARIAPAPADTFAMIAGVPKLLIILLVAVIWILSPIDLIPDSTPFVGNLDDIMVALLSANVAWQNFRRSPGGPPGKSVL